MNTKPITSNNYTAVDPTVDLKTPDGEEILQLIFDYNVAKFIIGQTQKNPLFGEMGDILNAVADGFEIVLYAMITKMGPDWDVPDDQRTITRKKVAEWCKDLHWVMNDGLAGVGECFRRGVSSRKEKDAPPVEDEGTDPNVRQTATATI